MCAVCFVVKGDGEEREKGEGREGRNFSSFDYHFE